MKVQASEPERSVFITSLGNTLTLQPPYLWNGTDNTYRSFSQVLPSINPSASESSETDKTRGLESYWWTQELLWTSIPGDFKLPKFEESWILGLVCRLTLTTKTFKDLANWANSESDFNGETMNSIHNIAKIYVVREGKDSS